jgi:hypothetical protein
MGSFYTNYQVRSDSTAVVLKALTPLAQAGAYVSPPDNGWITIYDEASDDQSDATIEALGRGLSHALKTSVLAFLVHDSDIFHYWLFEKGELKDEYDSDPEYFGQPVDEKALVRLRGNPDALVPLCRPGTTAAQIDAILHDPDAPGGMADDTLSDLVELLEIDESRAVLGFRYFADEGMDILPDAGSFEPLGGAEKIGGEGAEGDLEKANDDKVIRLFPPESETVEAEVVPTVPELEPFGLAVGDLAQYWIVPEQLRTMFGATTLAEFKQNRSEQIDQLRARFDRAARTMLRRSKLLGLPNYEDLKAARDKGPEALADMLLRFAPDQITNVAVGAIANRNEPFVLVLIAKGLDPDAQSVQGATPLAVAAMHMKGSKVYQMLKQRSTGV